MDVYISGFDLVDVGKDEVKIKAGKQANRRMMQFALQALVAIFGKKKHFSKALLTPYVCSNNNTNKRDNKDTRCSLSS